jgi:hypothetical protein
MIVPDVSRGRMNALGDLNFQIFSLDVSRPQSDDQLTDVNRETDAHRVNQLRSVTCEQEVLETNRDACRHLLMDVSLLSQMQNVMNAVDGRLRICVPDGRRENLRQSVKNAEVSLVTNRDACRHRVMGESRVSLKQSVMNAVDVSLIRNEKNVLGASSERSRSCAEIPLSETCSSHLSDVACESLGLRRWHHPCGGLPWRVERQS